MGWWKSKASDWRKVWELPRSDQAVLCQAALLLPLSALGLRLLGFQGWVRVLGRFGPKRPLPDADPPGRTQALARMVDVAARRGPWRANCLQRSVTLWWLLARQGIGCDLRIGVRRDDGKFEAHAWVEQQGVVINDQQTVGERFVPFDRSMTPPVAST